MNKNNFPHQNQNELGGGTGTGAAPLIAAEAKKRGILTVAICFLPFNFEGKQRSKVANKGFISFPFTPSFFVKI